MTFFSLTITHCKYTRRKSCDRQSTSSASTLHTSCPLDSALAQFVLFLFRFYSAFFPSYLCNSWWRNNDQNYQKMHRQNETQNRTTEDTRKAMKANTYQQAATIMKQKHVMLNWKHAVRIPTKRKINAESAFWGQIVGCAITTRSTLRCVALKTVSEEIWHI